jgi:hypothetical protein
VSVRVYVVENVDVKVWVWGVKFYPHTHTFLLNAALTGLGKNRAAVKAPLRAQNLIRLKERLFVLCVDVWLSP